MDKKEEPIFLPSIVLCIAMDLLGMAGTAFPVLGVALAPLSSFIFFKLFGGRLGVIGAILDFVEELFPFADIIPTFTIAWFIRKKTIDIKFRNNAQRLSKK